MVKNIEEKFDKIKIDKNFYIFHPKNSKFLNIKLSNKVGQISKLKKEFFLKDLNDNRIRNYKCNYCFLIKKLICNYTYDSDKRFIRHILNFEKLNNMQLIKFKNELNDFDIIDDGDVKNEEKLIKNDSIENIISKVSMISNEKFSTKQNNDYLNEENLIEQIRSNKILKSTNYLNELILKLSSKLKNKLIKQFNQFNDGLFFNLKTINFKLKENLLKENQKLILSLTNLELINLYKIDDLDENLDNCLTNNLNVNLIDNIDNLNNNIVNYLNKNDSLDEDNLIFEISIQNRDIILNLLTIFQTFLLDCGKSLTDEFKSILFKQKNQSLKILTELKNRPINNQIMENQLPTCSTKVENKRPIDNDHKSNEITKKICKLDNVITISSSEEESDNDDIILVETIEEENQSQFEQRLVHDQLFEDDVDLSELIENQNTVKNDDNEVTSSHISGNHLNDDHEISNPINDNHINSNHDKQIDGNKDSDTQITIYFEINDIRNFFQSIESLKGEEKSTRCSPYSRLSKDKQMGDYSWYIQASPVFSKDFEEKYLGFDIVCINNKKSISKKNRKIVWTVEAEGKLSIVNQIPKKNDLEYDFSKTFSNKDNKFGPLQYISEERLLNISKGFCKNNTIKLKAEIRLRKDRLALNEHLNGEQETCLRLFGLF